MPKFRCSRCGLISADRSNAESHCTGMHNRKRRLTKCCRKVHVCASVCVLPTNWPLRSLTNALPQMLKHARNSGNQNSRNTSHGLPTGDCDNIVTSRKYVTGCRRSTACGIGFCGCGETAPAKVEDVGGSGVGLRLVIRRKSTVMLHLGWLGVRAHVGLIRNRA